jgi:hypothetical protein
VSATVITTSNLNIDITVRLSNSAPYVNTVRSGYILELLERQQDLRNNRQRRAYKRDFEKWQVEAKEMLENEPA